MKDESNEPKKNEIELDRLLANVQGKKQNNHGFFFGSKIRGKAPRIINQKKKREKASPIPHPDSISPPSIQKNNLSPIKYK